MKHTLSIILYYYFVVCALGSAVAQSGGSVPVARKPEI
jgi:hypothetical protein